MSLLLASFFFFWLHLVARGILIPQARIEPVPPALEAQSLNHWRAREVPLWLFKCYFTLFYFYINAFLSLGEIKI